MVSSQVFQSLVQQRPYVFEDRLFTRQLLGYAEHLVERQACSCAHDSFVDSPGVCDDTSGKFPDILVIDHICLHFAVPGNQVLDEIGRGNGKVRLSRGYFGDETIIPPANIDYRVRKSRCSKLRVNLLLLRSF